MVEILVKTMKPVALLLLFFTLAGLAFGQAGPPGNTRNVILITLDGARTQEVFGGLDLEVLKSKTKKGSVEETPLYKKYYAETPEERREKLMPFFWGALMKQHGSIAGNRSLGSAAMTTNKMWFSYPGYSEILTGQAHDDVINSNDKKRNPYASVLEFLKRKLKLDAKQVAAFALGRDGFHRRTRSREHHLQRVYEPRSSRPGDQTARPVAERSADAVGQRAARLLHIPFYGASESYQPRVLYISLGETDDWPV